MNIWMVAREYAGIAEAGGVKNVVCSLSEELVKAGNKVTLFIPEYGCTDFSKVTDYRSVSEKKFPVECNQKTFDISFAEGNTNGVRIIFIQAELYKSKFNVYTYCRKDIENNPEGVIGSGYSDSLFLDIVYQKAVCEYAKEFNLKPDAVHCHDACAASLPAIAKILYQDNFLNTKFIVSIHNAGPAYHHEFSDLDEAQRYTGLSSDILASSLNGNRVEPYVLASHYGKLSTVSYDYAKELLDKDNHNTDGLSEIFCSRNTPIEGITNGIDINRYLPENTEISYLPFSFSPEKKDLEGKYKCRDFFLKHYANKGTSSFVINDEEIKQAGFLDEDPENKHVYISFHGRLVRQKGILVIIDLLDKIIERCPDIRFIINGQGEPFLQEQLSEKACHHEGKIVYLCGYEKSLARLCTASGDFALFPSEFEPCGLEDFIAQIYGTVPVAHATGGLKKIINGKSGFTYSPNTSEKLLEVLENVVSNKLQDSHHYDELVQSGALYVRENYTWEKVALEKYVPLYES